MKRYIPLIILLIVCVIVVMPALVRSDQLDPPKFGRLDHDAYRIIPSHSGAGIHHFQELIGNSAFGDDMAMFETPIRFFHRCRIPPRCGIGEHLHRDMEEMYWAFNAPAEFTVDGRTAHLPAGTSVVCMHDHSHGIFNPSHTDTLEFLNIAVMAWDGTPRSVDFKDSLTAKTVEAPAPFRWSVLDQSLLKPASDVHGGRGTIMLRRFYGPDMFTTPWESMEHVVMPTGTSIGLHRLTDADMVYYILSGSGRFTLNGHTWDIQPDDAIPATIGDARGVVSTGGNDLEFFVMTVSKKKGTTTVEELDDNLIDR